MPSPQTVLPSIPGHTEKFKRIVLQVQAALYVYGYYTGPMNGLVGPETKVALSKLQADYGLKVTGTVTPEVLNALGIAAK
jgi:His-Xaa-Ser repeat protein HxsA